MPKKCKRVNGEGSISRRKNGKYCGQISLGRGADGKLKRATVYADSYEDCRKLLSQKAFERDRKQLRLSDGSISVSEYCKDHLLCLQHKDGPEDRKGGLSNSCYNWYLEIHQFYIVPYLSDISISKFTAAKAQDFINRLSDTGLSVGTISGIRRTLNRAMVEAVKNGLLASNPLVGIKMPDDDDDLHDGEHLFIEKDKLEFMIGRLDELSKNGQYMELRFILLALLYSGMRIGEALGLQIGDIDFKENTVNICRQSKRYKKRNKTGEVIERYNDVGTLKTRTSKRVNQMNDSFRELVQERLTYLASKKNPELLKPDSFLFGNAEGKMRTYFGTRSSYERFIKRIGLSDEGYTLHTFRHTFISHCVASGIDIEYISRYVGHANSEITKRIYTHITKERDDKAIEAMNRAFKRTA